jgi:IS30 family transposase
VENFNGLVRQYFPKGSDFRLISRLELRRVEQEIDQRPRKTRSYKSPSELETKLAA